VEVDRSDGNSVCSVPKQVEGGKESEVSYEVDSQENRKCLKVDRSDEDEIKSECAVCQNKLKEEKSPKCHIQWIHKRMEFVVKLIEAMRMKWNPCEFRVQCAQTSRRRKRV
jgi:hypothetical protein